MAARKIFLLILVMAVMYGCSMYGTMYGNNGFVKGAGWTSGSTAAVSISQFSFSPSSFSFPAANSVIVTWTNNDNVTHTVTSDTALFNKTLSPGMTFSYAVPTNSSVTYTYHCSIHTYMTGSFTAN